jgi:hypothetical protein
MKTDKYSRRALLKGLGVGAGMLPLLNAEPALAQTGGVVKRLITITWTNGIVPSAFYPPAGPLTGTLPPILAPLDMWKTKILAMRGSKTGNAMGGVDSKVMVDAGNRYGGHSNYPSLLTGTAKGTSPSIDTLMSTSLKAAGFASPQLNVGVRQGNSSTSWLAGKVKNSAETDPYRLFTRLFAGASLPPAQVDSLLQRRKSVIDFVKTDLTSFSARLGTDDKAKVSAHLDSIRALEAQLTAPAPKGAGCQAPANTPAGVDLRAVASFPSLVKLMTDIVAAAVKCDFARAITIDLVDDGGGNSLTWPWLNLPSPDYHAIAHQGAGGYVRKTPIDTWYYQNAVANVVSQLAANPEGGSTSLDNSVVLVTNDMNEGSNHDVQSLPYLIVGSGGGFFKTGTCVQFPQNVPNNQLLTSVLHAMGLPVTSVGDTYTGDLDAMLKA